MREFRRIVRLLFVVLLVCTFASPLAAVSPPGAADHLHATDDAGLPRTHDAADHAITDHVHEVVTLGAPTLAPCWMPRARLTRLGQEEMTPTPHGRMDRPPRGLG